MAAEVELAGGVDKRMQARALREANRYARDAGARAVPLAGGGVLVLVNVDHHADPAQFAVTLVHELVHAMQFSRKGVCERIVTDLRDGYVLGGTRIVARRTWEGRTASRYERMLRAAEAAGNYEVAAEGEERGQRFRQARHQRRMDLLTAPLDAANGVAAGAGMGTGVLLLLGIAMAVAVAVANKDFADVATPVMAVVQLITWPSSSPRSCGVRWLRSARGLPWSGCGRWASTSRPHPSGHLPVRDRDTDGEPITPSIVVLALRNLGIAPLRTAIKDMGDAGASMLGAIRIAGFGVEVDVTLPSGVSTDDVQKRRRKLAENLSMHEHEVFITIPEAARTVRLWVADSGALDEPIGPSPLVTDETPPALVGA
ncbi:hypothetical protein QFZ67_003428 [Streptomyces sp. V1I1]|nr:hypothetical protein [Streptomyces sp. V1I1]